MNMKKTATILLALIVLFCLVPGAFAENGKGKYMVLYIEVNTGDIAAVYGADNILNFGKADEINVPVKKPKHRTDNGMPDGKPLPIKDEISRTSHTTIFSASSPGCRNIWYNGHFIQVCD